jgi:hypothetical protein
MSSFPAALALGAALGLATALPAHADGGSAWSQSGDAASRAAFLATSRVERPEALGLVLPPVRLGDPTRDAERDEATRARARIGLGQPKGATSSSASAGSLPPRSGGTLVGVSLEF